MMVRRQLAITLTLLISGVVAGNAQALEYRPGEVVVGYKDKPGQSSVIKQVDNVKRAISEMAKQPNVKYVVPNVIARGTGWRPNDPDLDRLQWNFIGPYGVNAEQAWTNLLSQRRPGGRGVTVAVIDSGIAYANNPPYQRSPDFTKSQFTAGYDFVGNDRLANDSNGHGTHVAGTIASATDNGIAVSGLAYGTRLMPLRVLDSNGEGNANDIARAIHFAIKKKARVINLSLEFGASVKARDIPQVIEALRQAKRKGVVVVGAAGNEGRETISYPAQYSSVIAVGASTAEGCLAEYSNHGPNLDLVAPGGGMGAKLSGDQRCSKQNNPQPIYQVTFLDKEPTNFAVPENWEGTSMATPHVSAAAALIIASGTAGPKPTPAKIKERLLNTARDLGRSGPDHFYGAGLLDAGRATSAHGE